jgi:RNA polymerase sigma-70 factor (ECF subfamily)
MQENDKNLIELCQKGDSEAFGALYDRYIRTIYNFIYYKTFHKETAEDLASETFFKALKSIQSVDPGKPFLSWLYKIAQNTVVDSYRAKRPTEDIDDFWDLSSGGDIEADTETALQVDVLREKFRELSSSERDIIIMRVWQDLSYKEIADIVGKSEASCKMTYSRALTKLRISMPFAAAILVTLAHILPHIYG